MSSGWSWEAKSSIMRAALAAPSNALGLMEFSLRRRHARCVVNDLQQGLLVLARNWPEVWTGTGSSPRRQFNRCRMPLRISDS